MADHSRILVISDTQGPFHHQDLLSFLKAVKKKYNPSFILHIGDLADFHGLNFHGVNPNLPSAHDELLQLRAFVKDLAKLFPCMTIVDSNHDALPKRKARSVGIPDAMLKDERSIIQAPDTWKFVPELVLRFSNGIRCKFKHNFSSSLLNDSKKQGISLVCGHLHTKSFIMWWMDHFNRLFFAMQVGCLINRKHAAFDYAKNNADSPVMTLGFIEDGLPRTIPMYCDRNNRWTGKV